MLDELEKVNILNILGKRFNSNMDRHPRLIWMEC